MQYFKEEETEQRTEYTFNAFCKYEKDVNYTVLSYMQSPAFAIFRIIFAFLKYMKLSTVVLNDIYFNL